MNNVCNWADLVLFLSDMKCLDVDKIRNWTGVFTNITIAAPGEKPGNISEDIVWYCYKSGEPRSDIWNHLLQTAQKPWVLFLEDDEVPDLATLPEEKYIKNNEWVPALIEHHQTDNAVTTHQYYQMRLARKGNRKVFDGKNIPDCTRYISENEIEISGQPIQISRGSSPVNINPTDEMSVKAFSPQLYLIQGEQHFKEKDYVLATAQYRKLLKSERLLPFDRLGAANGLASCLTEQYKWDQALKLAKYSIEAEPLQRLPYLIQFRIHQLNKQWEEALDVLNRYYEILNLPSRANFDKAIDEEETLTNLADLSIKAGLRGKAFDYMQQQFAMKKGDVEIDFVRKLLFLAIELSDYEKSVFFFKQLFENQFPGQLDAEQNTELNDIMSMFMKKGWYPFVSEIYEQLYESDPHNREYRRRLIVALSKTNRLDRARKLITDNG